MLKGISLRDLAMKIESNRNAKKDFIAPTTKLAMRVLDKVPMMEVFGSSVNFPMLPLAHDQVGSHLGIPSRYYERMLAEKPDLLATNVNQWFMDAKRAEEKRMVRVMHDHMRAFLSNKYQRIENEEIADVALPILSEIPEVKIVSCEVTDRRLYIQAVTPRVQGEVKKGDVVQAGVLITNSEVGCGAVSVANVIWRLICLNGMVGMDKFRAFHIGRKIEDNEDLWADDTKKADDRAVLLKVRDMVKAAVDEKRFAKSLDRMRELTAIKIEGDIQQAVEVLAPKIGAGEGEKSGILKALIEGGDLSAWGVLNAVTNQAHRAGDYDRAIELEAAGGMMMNMNRGDWKQVLEAKAVTP